MKKYIYILIIASALVSSCVYTFEPKGVEQQEGILVIEGDINIGDESVFVLSKSVNVDDSEAETASLAASDIYIEAETGAKYGYYSIKTEEDDNFKDNIKYSHYIDTKNLDLSVRYRLVVSCDDKHYTSSWGSYLETPPIDSVSYVISDDKTAIDIYVSSTGVNDTLNYYKWDYVEDWEFKADFYAVSYFLPDSDKVYDLPYEQNKYYCWKHNRSSNINIISTEQLSDNKVVNHHITNIASNDFRISYVYAIEVQQKTISKEAYTYWETMLRNNDGTGGIFSPQPSEMRGNITCVEDPQEAVLGYISVCSVQKERIFIYYKDTKIYYERKYCEQLAKPKNEWWRLSISHWDVVYEDTMTGAVYWAETKCVDCRTRGTKNKPDFWPMDDI